MEFDGVTSVVCDGEENDWLDVTYHERKYVAEETKPRKNLWKSIALKWKIVAALCLCVVAFGAVLLFSGEFRSGVVTTCKNAYAAVASIFEKKQDTVGNKVDIPCNAQLVQVTDGVATFGGGKATLAFAAGKVTKVDESSVTVQLDENISVCYGGLTQIFVAEGDEVTANQLLGRYNESFTATMMSDGKTIVDVVATETQIQWKI